MSIKKALAQIDTSEQCIPSNPLANTGLSDAVTWHEVREWLASFEDHQSISEDAFKSAAIAFRAEITTGSHDSALRAALEATK